MIMWKYRLARSYLCSLSSASSVSSTSDELTAASILEGVPWGCCGQTWGSANIWRTCVCRQRPLALLARTVAKSALFGISWCSIWCDLQLVLLEDEWVEDIWISAESEICFCLSKNGWKNGPADIYEKGNTQISSIPSCIPLQCLLTDGLFGALWYPTAWWWYDFWLLLLEQSFVYPFLAPLANKAPRAERSNSMRGTPTIAYTIARIFPAAVRGESCAYPKQNRLMMNWISEFKNDVFY